MAGGWREERNDTVRQADLLANNEPSSEAEDGSHRQACLGPSSEPEHHVFWQTVGSGHTL